MMQPIVVQNDSLARGVEQAGGALAQALGAKWAEKRKLEKYKTTNAAIEKEMSLMSENPTVIDMQKAISRVAQTEGVDPDYIDSSIKMLMPMYQQRMKAGESNRILASIFPESKMFGGNTEQQQIEAISQQNPQQARQIQQAQLMQQQGIPPFVPTDQGVNQQQIAQLQRQQMQPPFMALNQGQRQLPQQAQQAQQMQQAQQAQQLQQPQQQSEQRPSASTTINSPGLGEVSREKIDYLLAQDNAGAREVGKSLDARWNEQYKQGSREQAEIRKEYRDEIKKYSEPYQDINKLEAGVNKLKEAQKLIESGNVSFGENWLRNSVQSILEGQEHPLSEAIKTTEQQKLWYLLKDSLKTKDIGGSNPSTKEVLLSKTTLPSEMKSQDANEYIIGNLLQNADNELYKAKAISSERKKGGTPSYIEFQSNIDKEVGGYSQKKQQEFEKTIQKKQLVNVAKEKVGSLTPEKGFVYAMKPDGSVGQIDIKDIKRVQDAGGTILSKTGPKKPKQSYLGQFTNSPNQKRTPNAIWNLYD